MFTSRETQKVIILSAITTTVILFILGLVVWSERTTLARYILAGNTAAGSAFDERSSQESIIATVKKVDPAVVTISVSKEVQLRTQSYQSPFNDLFGRFFSPLQQGTEGQTEQLEVGGGSGFFVTQDGLIVTNKHVVSDPDAEYTVYTTDGKKYDAKVIARDPFIDIAVLKVDGTGFPFLSFSTASPEIGQTAIAIGNALGEFSNSVSVGVVSGLSRSIIAGDRIGGESEILDEVIQTDAAINPGNSGGPLLDIDGRVIGVNVAVALGSENIGFALPAKGLADIVQSVKNTGTIVRPYLGIRYTDITPAIKEAQNLAVNYGALVERGNGSNEPAILPGSPAAKAGIVEGDIILEIDGVRLENGQKLSSIIRGKQVGQKVMLKVLREGKERVVQITLEAYKG